MNFTSKAFYFSNLYELQKLAFAAANKPGFFITRWAQVQV